MMINELIERSHAMAVEKGWWDGGERSVVDQVNNFHAEISEAWEEYRAGRMDLWWSDQDKGVVPVGGQFGHHDLAIRRMAEKGLIKPEGFWIEIADLCIRLADTMGAYGWKFTRLRPHDSEQIRGKQWALPCLISTLHVCVGCIGIDQNGDIGGEFENDAERTASGIIDLCMMAAEYHGIDLLSLCELKMTYNATRPHRHGGKRA